MTNEIDLDAERARLRSLARTPQGYGWDEVWPGGAGSTAALRDPEVAELLGVERSSVTHARRRRGVQRAAPPPNPRTRGEVVRVTLELLEEDRERLKAAAARDEASGLGPWLLELGKRRAKRLGL